MRCSVLQIFAALIAAAGPASAELHHRNSYSGYVAVMTDESWMDIVYPSSRIDYRNSYIFGATVSREWTLGRFANVGIEGALYRHDGEQDLWEVAAPLYIRSGRPASPYIPNLGFGLGLSYTLSDAEVEIDRKGATENLLLTWFIELEFRSRTRNRPYLRLHHRSEGFGLMGADSGSNAVGVGWRRDF